jgi:hypothetical protein
MKKVRQTETKERKEKRDYYHVWVHFILRSLRRVFYAREPFDIYIYRFVCLTVLRNSTHVAGTGIAQSVKRQARAGRLGFDSRHRQKTCLFSVTSKPALGPTKPPIL